MNPTVNADPAELAKFSELAHRWWDTESEFRPLHQINPLRLGWIQQLCPLAGRRVLKTDLWDEARNTRILQWMEQRGAAVAGIDISGPVIQLARREFGDARLMAAGADVQAVLWATGHRLDPSGGAVRGLSSASAPIGVALGLAVYLVNRSALDEFARAVDAVSGQADLHPVELELRTALAEKMIVDFDYLPLPDLLDRDPAGGKATKKDKEERAPHGIALSSFYHRNYFH